jgi:transketolase
MDAVEAAGSGHPGTAMALAPLGYLIYTRHLRHDPADPAWPGRDRFVLSCGHACILQYALLHLTGYDLSLEDLKQFRQWGSRTPGHPEHGVTPGIETTTGPLGQGLGNAIGMAIAERFCAERYNRPGFTVVDHAEYVICSDGDLMEGVASEAASLAGQLGLGKLVVCYDDNHITIDGSTDISFAREDSLLRFAAYDWHVQRVDDANDLDALDAALTEARAELDRPSLIAVRSHIAYGAPHAVDTPKAHGAPLGPDEVRAAKENLGADPDATFAVDDRVRAHMDMRPRGAELHREWQDAFDRWADAHPDLTKTWRFDRAQRPREGYAAALPTFPAGKPLATRAAGREAMNALAPYLETMIGGAADLVESTRTEIDGGGLFTAEHAGRNIAFGVREHGMAAIVNGIALHECMTKPFGSTFLIFSDYLRPALRLSALMGLGTIFVFTHDSVALGEDGPTHQPVEHHMALRAIPNLWYVRPADANETSVAWRVAVERQGGPVALALSRQAVPTFDRHEVASADGLARGAYVLWDAPSVDEVPELIVIATGAEVAPALEAARLLADGGIAVRIVSMPCFQLFEMQPPAYREQVLPRAVAARLSVEAGVSRGWRAWIGDAGASVAIDRFGASAPGTQVLERFGFTAANIADRARALLASAPAPSARR